MCLTSPLWPLLAWSLSVVFLPLVPHPDPSFSPPASLSRILSIWSSCSAGCSCRTSPRLCQHFVQHLCTNTVESKSTFHVATDLGRKSRESGFSLSVSKIKNQNAWFCCEQCLRALAISLIRRGTISPTANTGHREQVRPYRAQKANSPTADVMKTYSW